MALPDVPDTYQIVMVQNFQTQEVLNVFYYRDTLIGTFAPVNIAHGFWDHMKAAWRAAVKTTSNLEFIEVRATALFSPYEFATYVVPLAERQGTRVIADDLMPPTIAASVKLQVATRTTRPGSKRITGLTEADVTISLLTGAYPTLLANLAALFDDPVTPTGAATTVKPVIVGYPGVRNPVGVRVQDITGAQAGAYVSHQVSRDARP